MLDLQSVLAVPVTLTVDYLLGFLGTYWMLERNFYLALTWPLGGFLSLTDYETPLPTKGLLLAGCVGIAIGTYLTIKAILPI